MAVLYGARLWNEAYGTGSPDYRYDVIGNNSEDFDTGDPVSVSGGDLIVYSGTSAIVGVAVKDQTLTSDNETVLKVKPGFISSEDHVFLMGTNSDLTDDATDYGKYYKNAPQFLQNWLQLKKHSTEKGKVFWMRVYEIPEGGKTSKGRAIQNIINISKPTSLLGF